MSTPESREERRKALAKLPCPPFPEKCPVGMACGFHDPLTQCPYRKKADNCCVTEGTIMGEKPESETTARG